MTLEEVELVINAGADKLEYDLRLQVQMQYEQAQNIAVAVTSLLSGKKPPTIQEVYPSLFGVADDTQEQEHKPQMWEIYKEQFLDFANLHNKNRKKKEG